MIIFMSQAIIKRIEGGSNGQLKWFMWGSIEVLPGVLIGRSATGTWSWPEERLQDHYRRIDTSIPEWHAAYHPGVLVRMRTTGKVSTRWA